MATEQKEIEVAVEQEVLTPTTVRGEYRPIREIIADLTKPVAARHIKQRKQGGATLDYIEWHTACKYLDHYAPGWGWEILKVDQIGSLLVVHGRLSIPCAEGVVSRDATGIEDMTAKGYGDPVSNAHAMAFKRAAAFHGLGRHLYEKD